VILRKITSKTVDLFVGEHPNKNRVDGFVVDEISPETLTGYTSQWFPLIKGEEDEGWSWEEYIKEYQHGYRRYALISTNDNLVQGLMIVQESIQLRSAANSDFLGCCVVYLAAAPWNRQKVRGKYPQGLVPYRHCPIGSRLMACAIELSHALGHEGRIGWHSLEGAKDDYQRMFANLYDLGPDEAEGGLPWYEIDTRSAKSFVAKLANSIIVPSAPICGER
jgi:hypothetical protein